VSGPAVETQYDQYDSRFQLRYIPANYVHLELCQYSIYCLRRGAETSLLNLNYEIFHILSTSQFKHAGNIKTKKKQNLIVYQ